MSEWKDETSYSRDDVDRTPRTWAFEVGDIRMIVTRKWNGREAGYSGWHTECHPFLNIGPDNADVELVKTKALTLLKQELEATLEAIAKAEATQ